MGHEPCEYDKQLVQSSMTVGGVDGADRADAEPATRPLWRNWDFQLLFVGSLTSVVGSEIAAIGYPLLVLAVTGSPAQAGLVAFAETLSAVLAGLPAGALVDR